MNILLLIVGIVLLAWGVFLISKNVKLTKNGIKMQAEIVDVLKKQQRNTDEDGYTTTTNMYYPVFQYEYDGQEYRKEASFGVNNPRKYVKGNMLDIVFMKETPEKVKVKNVMGLWFTPGLLIFLGAIFLISSFFV